jgi:hypothetical protein
MTTHGAIAGLILSATLLGCTSTYPKADRTASRSAINEAESVGAGQVPRAALHLQLAKDQLAYGERLLADGENDAAYLAFERAEADAKLAGSLARDQQLQREAAQAMQRVEQLRRGTL